ncbi:trichohyalin-like isoform X2 [Cephus cinctus]|uniref:Trichohyalin-like isoform X2 n=1 Tax=Cephus cinctus TaxID=211228 RepID=A0AAJ7RBD8_CEPCN|nr:trichohyalin-like isoform X2 [Cephus cinctus]
MRKFANMEFRVLLWLLCIAYAFATVTSDATTENAELEVTKDSDSSATELNKTDENGTNHNNSDNKPRDKRTLGMILTGLAGILGYTVSPIQAASLPNPTLPPTSSLPAIPIPVFPVGIPAAPAPPPQPPAPPKERENIRLTGVVNFGNNGDLLGHLQQYEQIFHGAAAASSPAKPRPKPPIGPPILADIPSPIAPNLPAPYPPAPAPRPTKPLPMRTEYEVEYRNNQNIENYKIENKELKDETELTTPSSKYTHDIYIQEPNWKKNYDDRLAQLERQQEEYAERLTQHEAQSKPKEEEEEIVERYPNREKEIADRDREYAAKLREQEESKHESDHRDYENDREEPREKNENYSQGKQYEDYSEEPPRYRDYDNDSRNKYKEYTDYEEAPDKSSNQDHEEKLPIIRNDEDYKPEVPMNSYGESLERQGEIDENIADYFSKFKNPHTGMYDTDRIQTAGGEGEGSRWEQSLKDQDRIRQEYSSPAPESRYEEYDLEDEEPRKESIKESENVENLDDDVGTTRETYVEQKTPDYSEAFGRYEPYSKNLEPEEGDHVLTSQSESGSPQESYRKDDSSEESRNDEQSEEPKRKPPPERYEFNFKNYNPYFAPIQYIYSKDELEDTTAKILSSYKNSEASKDEEQGSDEEESRKHIHEEELRPKIGLPEKLALKNLHEGEAKEINAWPAPFDYVFDSTEQTIVAQAKNSEQAPKSIPNQEPTYQTPYERPINHGPKSEDYKDQPEADDREDYKNYNQVPSADDVDDVSPRQGYVLKSTSSTPFYPNGGYLESFRADDGPADHQEPPAASSGPAPKNEESQRNRESHDGPASFLDRVTNQLNRNRASSQHPSHKKSQFNIHTRQVFLSKWNPRSSVIGMDPSMNIITRSQCHKLMGEDSTRIPRGIKQKKRRKTQNQSTNGRLQRNLMIPRARMTFLNSAKRIIILKRKIHPFQVLPVWRVPRLLYLMRN